MRKKVLIIGPSPQNIGGIAIHIKRLIFLLSSDYLFDIIDEGHIRYPDTFNLRSLNLFTYFSKIIKADIIHIHSGIWMVRCFHILICKILFRKKVIVTIHRDPTIEPHANLTKRLLSHCDYAILVNKEGFDSMHTKSRCKYVLLPAFLPPDLEGEPSLPKEINQWIECARQNPNSFLLCSNAWNLVLHEGVDLYGLDICIEAMKQLKNSDIKYYLVFVVASNSDQHDRMAKYKELIVDYELSDQILIWEQPISFVRLLQKCDLVLRTTNTDGDALSIREALYYGKQVLASDIVKRPEGIYLFKTREVDDLVNKINEIAMSNSGVNNLQAIDYREIYLRMYK